MMEKTGNRGRMGTRGKEEVKMTKRLENPATKSKKVMTVILELLVCGARMAMEIGILTTLMEMTRVEMITVGMTKVG